MQVSGKRTYETYQQGQTPTLESLPPELLAKIANRLDVQYFLNFGATCRQLRSVTKMSQFIGMTSLFFQKAVKLDPNLLPRMLAGDISIPFELDTPSQESLQKFQPDKTKSLQFTGEKVKGTVRSSLLQGLGIFPNLERLQIDKSSLTADEAEILSQALAKLPKLTSLTLERGSLTDDQGKNLLTALAAKTSLTHLNLESSFFGFDAVPYFNQIFKANRHLSEFRFSELTAGGIPERDTHPLEEATSLVALKYTPTHLSQTGCDSLASSLSKMRNLRHLELGGSLVSPDIGAMLNGVSNLHQLNEFVLRGYSINAGTLPSFCSALSRMTNLSSLTLSDLVAPSFDRPNIYMPLFLGMTYQDDGILAGIFQSVSTLTTLQKLEISKFSFGAVRSNLKNLTNLVHLNVSFTHLDPSVFAGLPRLKSLDFRRLTREMETLLPVIPTLQSLEDIHVTKETYSEDANSLVSLIQAASPSLRRFILHTNNPNPHHMNLGIGGLLNRLEAARPDVKVEYSSEQ